MERRSTWKHFKILLMYACIGACVYLFECMGLLAGIQCTTCMELKRKVCVFHYPAVRFLTTLLSSGLSEEQSFLSVSQSVFGEMIVGFRERAALFGQEQARIALFPFIIVLLLSPPNILLFHLLSFCPFLPYSSFPLFPLFSFSFLPCPSPPPSFSPPPTSLSPSVSPSPDWGSVLLVRQPMCLSVCVRER